MRLCCLITVGFTELICTHVDFRLAILAAYVSDCFSHTDKSVVVFAGIPCEFVFVFVSLLGIGLCIWGR